MKEVIKNSAIKGYHEFQVRSHKAAEILILVTPYLLFNKSNLIVRLILTG